MKGGKEYEFIPWGKEDYAVSFTGGKYYGVVYKYKGAVNFKPVEESEELVMNFDYEVLVGKELIESTVDFDNVVGNILVDKIQEDLAKNNLVFTGGVEGN